MKRKIVDNLVRILGKKKVYTDTERLNERRHDYSFVAKLDDMQCRAAPRPACVVTPATTRDVVKVVNTCRETGTAIVPFGLGSGVVCGVKASPDAVLLPKAFSKAKRAAEGPRRPRHLLGNAVECSVTATGM